MTTLEVEDTVSELIHLYSGWSPHASETELWSRMFSRFELSAREAIGAIRGYRETSKGDRSSPKISALRQIINAAAIRKKMADSPSCGNKNPVLGYTIRDIDSPGRGFPLWFPRADQMPERPELEQYAFIDLQRIEEVYGQKHWIVVWPELPAGEEPGLVCSTTAIADLVPF